MVAFAGEALVDPFNDAAAGDGVLLAAATVGDAAARDGAVGAAVSLTTPMAGAGDATESDRSSMPMDGVGVNALMEAVVGDPGSGWDCSIMTRLCLASSWELSALHCSRARLTASHSLCLACSMPIGS